MNKNVSLVPVNECSGCGLCSFVCPSGAIRFLYDPDGFLNPDIDHTKCTNCGICLQRCPVISSRRDNGNFSLPEALVCWHKDDETVRRSSSGGVFSALAEYCLGKKGTVYGAVWCDDLSVRHKRVEDSCDIALLRGSKYVQSTMEHIYVSVANDLKNGRLVLFSGTPCQIAGIQSINDNKPSNLFTCEVICHGVVSAIIFNAYVKYMENMSNAKIRRIDFRYKSNCNWEKFSVKLFLTRKK